MMKNIVFRLVLLVCICFPPYGSVLASTDEFDEWVEVSAGISSATISDVANTEVISDHHAVSAQEAIPKASPTFQPTNGDEEPVHSPTFQPTNGDLEPQTSFPTINSSSLSTIFYSPTWASRNQAPFAFTVSSATSQKLYVYGDMQAGGNMTLVQNLVNAYTQSTGSYVVKIASSLGGYAALLSDGSMVAWGLIQSIAGWESYQFSSLSDLVATDKAFAGVTTEGQVVCFGAGSHGGRLPESLQQALSSGVAGIAAASAGAFAAWKTDGTVYTWGNRYAGGGVSTYTKPSLSNIVHVLGTEGAFVGLRASGTFVTWGSCFYGGCFEDEEEIALQLSFVTASPTVFLGYTENSQLVAWGMDELGGAIPEDIQSQLVKQVRQVDFVLTNRWSIVALVNGNTSVLCWGDESGGGDCADIQQQLVDEERFISIAASEKAYAVITSQGRVLAWGDAQSGGSIPISLLADLSSDVVEIVANKGAFAARKSTGKVVAWGNAVYGGSTSAVASLVGASVVKVLGSSAAFLAVLSDGRVVGWGHALTINSPGVQSPLVELEQTSQIVAY